MKKRKSTKPVKKFAKKKTLFSEPLLSDLSKKRVHLLKPSLPRVKTEVPKILAIPEARKPPMKVVLSDKGEPIVPLSRLHRGWANLGTVLRQKRLFQYRTKDKVRTYEKNYLQFGLPGVKLNQLGRHLFGDLLRSGAVTTGLLYDTGFHVTEKPALKFIAQKKALVDFNTIEKLAIDLQSCDNSEKRILPDFNNLIKDARSYYKEKKIVPIIVLDIDFESLSKSAKKSLAIDRFGVLQIDEVAEQIKKKNLYAYAPLSKQFGYKKVQFVVDKRFVFTNREIPDRYSFSVDRKPYSDLEVGKPFSIEFKKPDQEVIISIALGADRKELAQTFLTSALARAIPPWDLSWEPTRIVADSDPDVGRSTAIRAQVLHSIIHDPNGPEIQNPVIFLGGFDENISTSYELLYDQIASIESPDFIGRLREVFDVVLLTYDDVGVSIELNATALAFTLRDIIERNESRDGLVFIGISMGGLVSRMVFAGIENNIFSNIDAALGGPITEHNVKVWVTIDTPHQGAHIPLGLQYLVHSLRWFPVDEIQKVIRLLDSTSAKEMLIDHYESAPATHSERIRFGQTLNSWGGFPTEIDTTVAVSSGALAYNRAYQAYFEAGNDCEPTTFTGCVHTYDEWAPQQSAVDLVRNDPNCMYFPQSNRSGIGGVRILDTVINFEEEWGLPGRFFAFIKARAVEDYSYWLGQSSPNTPVMSRAFEVDVLPDILEFILQDPVFESAEAITPGIPYELYVGGWLPTAETLYDYVSAEFPTATDSGGVALGGPHLWMPRHCFVPLISALDVPEAFLINKFRFLWIYHFDMINTGILSPFVPSEAVVAGEFLYEYFVDYSAMFYPLWYLPEPPTEPFNENDPYSFTGKAGSQSSFDWVYFHQENRRHGDIDARAVEFIMDKIIRTLSGELPRQPTPGYSGPPPNMALVDPIIDFDL